MPVLTPVYSITGLSPDKTSSVEYWMDQAYILGLRDRGLTFKYYDSVIVSDVLTDAKAIAFRGLKRFNNSHDGLCFCSKPKQRYLAQGDNSLPKGMVFAVYVMNTDEHDNEVIDWDWWPEDALRPGFPMNWRNDYEVLLWPLTV